MNSSDTERLARSIRNTATLLDCGRTTVYELLKAGKLKAVKLGGRTLVLDASIRVLLASLPPAGGR
jgi:excisionase family DNA binding protein